LHFGSGDLIQDAVAKASQTTEGLPVALDKHIPDFATEDAALKTRKSWRMKLLTYLMQLGTESPSHKCLETKCHICEGGIPEN
jgi:hypothetical protein